MFKTVFAIMKIMLYPIHGINRTGLLCKDMHMTLEIHLLTINWAEIIVAGCKVSTRQTILFIRNDYFNPLIVITFSKLIILLINDIAEGIV
jgi:hypothetical protein